MTEPSPFVIKIPEGATEIDLGPILRPLIFAIIGSSLQDPKKLEKYWLKGKEDLDYRELLPVISRQMICDYLGNNGFVDEYDPRRGYTFIYEYQKKQSAWDRHGPWIRLSSPDSFNLHTADNIIRQVTSPLDKTKLELARAIIASANILDRIVAELD